MTGAAYPYMGIDVDGEWELEPITLISTQTEAANELIASVGVDFFVTSLDVMTFFNGGVRAHGSTRLYWSGIALTWLCAPVTPRNSNCAMIESKLCVMDGAERLTDAQE